jgi:hypothetical protein
MSGDIHLLCGTSDVGGGNIILSTGNSTNGTDWRLKFKVSGVLVKF